MLINRGTELHFYRYDSLVWSLNDQIDLPSATFQAKMSHFCFSGLGESLDREC